MRIVENPSAHQTVTLDYTMLYNDRFKGVSIWSENMPLSATEMDKAKHLVSWVESGMNALASVPFLSVGMP